MADYFLAGTGTKPISSTIAAPSLDVMSPRNFAARLPAAGSPFVNMNSSRLIGYVLSRAVSTEGATPFTLTTLTVSSMNPMPT